MEITLEHFKKLGKSEEDYISKIKEAIDLAGRARQSGLDPAPFIESQFIISSYERISTILGLRGIDERLKELRKKIKDRYKLAYQIAEDIVLGRFAFLDNETSLLLAARAAITILTKGARYHYITSIRRIELRKNGDATIYPAIVLSENSRIPLKLLIFLIVLLDKLRRLLGLDHWKIETLQRKHILSMLRDLSIHIRGSNITIDGVVEILKRIPIEIVEEKNGKTRTSVHFSKLIANLFNYSSFLKKLCSSLNLEGWEWVNQLPSTKELGPGRFGKHVVVSSDVFGGFRLITNQDLPKNVVGLHPAVYALLRGKIGYGSKLYINGKGPYGVTFLENISPPVVKLKDGTVKVFTGEREDLERIKEILFFGDLALSSIKVNVYTESKWFEDLYKASRDDLLKVVKEGRRFHIIKEVSEKHNIPLHPSYVFFLPLLSVSEILKLRGTIKTFEAQETPKLIFESSAKPLLEKALVPFKIIGGEVNVEGDNALALYHLLRPDKELKEIPTETSELLSYLSGFKIPNISSSFASFSFKIKLEQETRKTEGPHVIFPLGDYYQISKDVLDHGTIYVELANLYCDRCSIFTLGKKCPKCGVSTKLIYFCERCKKFTAQERCEVCNSTTKPNSLKGVDIVKEVARESELIGLKPLRPLIGIEELKSYIKIPELLSKGIIRQYHAITVDEDATVKFPTYICFTNIFKIANVETSVEKIKWMGYEADVFIEKLSSDDQYIQIKPYDIIIPKEAANLFLKVARYLDELLIRVYKLKEYYKAEAPEDLLGHLVVLVPEGTNTGLILRIIGFTKDNVAYIHPSTSKVLNINFGFQLGKLSLLLDTLINFSKFYVEEEVDGFPSFIQPVLKKDAKNESFYFSHINLRKGPLDKISFKDTNEVLQFQLQLIREVTALSKKEVIHQVMTVAIIKNLFDFIVNATTGKFTCSGCNLLLRRVPLSRKCPICRKEVEPLFPLSSLDKIIYALKNFSEQLEDPRTKEKLMLAIENIEMLTRAKKQTTISEFL